MGYVFPHRKLVHTEEKRTHLQASFSALGIQSHQHALSGDPNSGSVSKPTQLETDRQKDSAVTIPLFTMLLQNWRGFAGLPSQHCPSNEHFPHGFAEIESMGLPSKVAESSRRNHQPSQPFSAAELKRINMDLSPKVLLPSKIVVNGASGLLELSSSRGRVGEYSREFLHPKHPQRARSMSPPQVLHTKGSRIDISDGTEHNSSTVRRRPYFYRLPNWNTREDSSTQPLAGRRQSCSELDLRASLPEELPRKLEEGETCSVRNLELELNMMLFELFSLKQKQMESSFAHIEKEKQWLERTCLEDRKHKGHLDDKLFSLETELVKARSSLGKRNHGPLSSPGSNQNSTVEELVSLQSSLLAHKSHIKALEEKQEEMGQELETAKEGQRKALGQAAEASQRAADSQQANQVLNEDRGKLQVACSSISLEKDRLEEKVRELSLKLASAVSDWERVLQEKVALHQEVQHLTLELERARKQQEGSNDQVSALHSELVCAKTQVNHQDKEKVLMEEELESTRQACKMLSSEAAESRQRLEASLEKLHRSEAEKQILEGRIRALENEQSQLLEEAEGRGAALSQEDRRKLEEEVKALQETCANLRESWRLLQREKDILQARTLELEAALQAKQEEVGSRLDSQEHIPQDRRGRQRQQTAAAKTREEELQNMSAPGLSAKGQSQDSEAKVTRSPQEEQESLRRQHQLVTEQLKGLFRQQQAGYKKDPGRPKEESSAAPLKSQGMLTVAKPIRLPEEGQAELQGVPGTGGEAQSLQQQLREKTEIITSMASEIQALKQKNEALMKAKLRFQQQIQEIGRLSKQGPEKSRAECLVPQLSTNPDRDVQNAHGCNNPVPSPQRNELISSICGRENWPAATQEAQLHSGAEEERSCVSSDTSVAHLSATTSAAHGNLLSAWPRPSLPGSSGPTVPSAILLLPPTTSHQEGQGHLEGEGTLLSPRSSALLSPRPFGSPRPWSPFKFRGSPEPSEEDRTEGELEKLCHI
ncbi:trichohyalin-like isoform X3 [Zootoca vivipara]|uniref:trichohyalin-like isoform X3 n=1 Tax=Zootoca vivipara TaxID=8524 RepID=UPI00293BB7A9|nr:trichohyalin-like isoform X3 [Zootoca vivipara]